MDCFNLSNIPPKAQQKKYQTICCLLFWFTPHKKKIGGPISQPTPPAIIHHLFPLLSRQTPSDPAETVPPLSPGKPQQRLEPSRWKWFSSSNFQAETTFWRCFFPFEKLTFLLKLNRIPPKQDEICIIENHHVFFGLLIFPTKAKWDCNSTTLDGQEWSKQSWYTPVI